MAKKPGTTDLTPTEIELIANLQDSYGAQMIPMEDVERLARLTGRHWQTIRARLAVRRKEFIKMSKEQPKVPLGTMVMNLTPAQKFKLQTYMEQSDPGGGKLHVEFKEITWLGNVAVVKL